MALRIGPEDVLVWSALAFGVWLLLIATGRWLRLQSGAAAAAALSWVVARVLMWSAPAALHWVRAVLGMSTGWTSWR